MMICPFMSRDSKDGAVECVKDKCAIYNRQEKSCGILSLAKKMGQSKEPLKRS